jgi:hypothetical protein
MLINCPDNQTSYMAQTTARVQITEENKGTIDLNSELVLRQIIRCDGIEKVLRIIVMFIIHRIKIVEHRSFV